VTQDEFNKIVNKDKMSKYTLKQDSAKVTVTDVVADGTYQDKSNKMQYKYVFTFSDGVVMSASYEENNCPFKKDDEVIYKVNYANDRGCLGSVRSANEQPKPPYGKGGGSGWKPKSLTELKMEQMVRNPSMALAYAKDHVVAVGHDPTERTEDSILALADSLLKWLNEKTLEVKEVPNV
jgi:hypothetical protein